MRPFADGRGEGEFRGFRFEGEGLSVEERKRPEVDDGFGEFPVLRRGEGSLHAENGELGHVLVSVEGGGIGVGEFDLRHLFEDFHLEGWHFHRRDSPLHEGAKEVEEFFPGKRGFGSAVRVEEITLHRPLLFRLNLPKEDEALPVFDGFGGEGFPRFRVGFNEGEGGVVEVGHGFTDLHQRRGRKRTA